MYCRIEKCNDTGRQDRFIWLWLRKDQAIGHQRDRDQAKGKSQDQGVEMSDLRIHHDQKDHQDGCGGQLIDVFRLELRQGFPQKRSSCKVCQICDRGNDQNNGKGQNLVISEPGGQNGISDTEFVAIGQLVEFPCRLIDQLAVWVEERHQLITVDHGLST